MSTVPTTGSPTLCPTSSPPLRPVAHPMRLLADGVPLSLLLDLAAPGGPDSRRILVEEGRVAVSWLPLPPGRRRALRTRAAAG